MYLTSLYRKYEQKSVANSKARSIKSVVNTFWDIYIRSEIRDITQVKIQRAMLKNNWNEFQQVQAAIEESADAHQNESENFQYRENFEE